MEIKTTLEAIASFDQQIEIIEGEDKESQAFITLDVTQEQIASEALTLKRILDEMGDDCAKHLVKLSLCLHTNDNIRLPQWMRLTNGKIYFSTLEFVQEY